MCLLEYKYHFGLINQLLWEDMCDHLKRKHILQFALFMNFASHLYL